MSRRPDWRSRLSAHLSSLDHVGHDWTGNDCLVLLVGGAIEAQTGDDLVAPFRDRWTTFRGALRVMQNEGFGNLADAVGSVLPEIHVSRASTGDIVAVPSDDGFGFILGVVTGPNINVLAEHGRAVLPITSATRAFKV